MKEKGSKRRSFLKNAALLSWTLPVSITNDALSVFGEEKILKHKASNEQTNNSFTILITSDIHAQLHTHDEFFWENEKAIYKKRGGLAVLKTMINILIPMTHSDTLQKIKNDFEVEYGKLLGKRFKSIDRDGDEKIDNNEMLPFSNSRLIRL